MQENDTVNLDLKEHNFPEKLELTEAEEEPVDEAEVRRQVDLKRRLQKCCALIYHAVHFKKILSLETNSLHYIILVL